jgi:biotin operon repressor
MADLKVEVGLTLWLDTERNDKPANWDWMALLDLGPDEHVEVTRQRVKPYEPALPSEMPMFDGETFQPEFDYDRLGAQMRSVYDQMSDGRWHTIEELAERLDAPAASVSARIRDLRKGKFGGFRVDRVRATGGLFRYRLVAGSTSP